MKKRTYRARKINQLELGRLARRTDGEHVVVGLDIAKHVQFAAFSVGSKEVVETVRWRLPEQTTEFLDLLTGLPCSSLEVALEPTGSYGDALRYQMLNRGLDVFRVSAKKGHDAREVYDGVPSSHDAKAAAIVAWLHLDGASEPWPMMSEGERALTAAIGMMSVYDEQYQQGLNRLEALLARHWPEATGILKLETVTLLTVLAEFGGPEEIARHRVAAQRLMRKTGGSALSEKKVSALLGTAHETVGVAQVETESQVLSELARETLRSKRARRVARARVEQLSQDMPEVEAMGAVVGRATAAVLTSKIGSPLSFHCARAYEKSGGLNLRENSSGKYQGRLRITKRGSGRARQYLFLAVLRLIQADPLCRAWYLKKVERDGGVKLKAIVGLMRKLIRALWHVARGNEFDSALLFDARRLVVTATT